eukprot:7071563-Alexandrium_andersonii.AAC.1
MTAIASASVVARGGAVGVALAAREPVSLLDVRAFQEDGPRLLLARAESQMGLATLWRPISMGRGRKGLRALASRFPGNFARDTA